jgi:hypothetical protein
MPDEQFKRIIGTTKPVFETMLDVLQTAYIRLHRSGGKPPKLSLSDKLLITLQYYREYRTMEHIALDFGVAKSSVCRSIVWVEETLSADGRFQLPGKEALQDGSVETVAIDVTEHPIERPQKNRKTGIPVRKSDTPSNHKSSQTKSPD